MEAKGPSRIWLVNDIDAGEELRWGSGRGWFL